MDWRTRLLMRIIYKHLNGLLSPLLSVAVNGIGYAYDFVMERIEASELRHMEEEERVESHRRTWQTHYRRDESMRHMQAWANRIIDSLPAPKYITADELLGRGLREGWLHLCPTCDYTDRKACGHCGGHGYWTNHEYETVAKAFDTIR